MRAASYYHGRTKKDFNGHRDTNEIRTCQACQRREPSASSSDLHGHAYTVCWRPGMETEPLLGGSSFFLGCATLFTMRFARSA